MSPLRIIILVILFYIGYRLIFGGGKKQKEGRGTADNSSREMPASDTLEEDPVCKKLVPRQQAVQYESNGITHYFCSKKCCKTYRNQQGEQ